jgi:hypothetical protein
MAAIKPAHKKDRDACATRSKSREETPKEGIDRTNLSDAEIMLHCTNVKRRLNFINY